MTQDPSGEITTNERSITKWNTLKFLLLVVSNFLFGLWCKVCVFGFCASSVLLIDTQTPSLV